jgi:nucleoside-diphosphate-sugar epimerase
MKKVVILGCGFVGRRAARLFAEAGWETIGVTHSAESAAMLNGEAFRAMACDITDARGLAAAKELRGANAVISAVSSGRGGVETYRAIYLRGIQNAIERLGAERALFVSSTSVYGLTDGAWVTEESPAAPESPTSRVLREAEEETLAHAGSVARLAAIYGPGRSVLLRRFMDGTAMIEGDGGRCINQIHADDAARALFHIIARELPAGIYNVADDKPMTQLACYEFLARKLGRPIPPCGTVDTPRKRAVTNKRVSNAKLKGRGWTLTYPSFEEALAGDEALLAAARGDESGDGRP